MKRFSTFPLIDNELNRLDERIIALEGGPKAAGEAQDLSQRLRNVEGQLEKLLARKKPGPKPK